MKDNITKEGVSVAIVSSFTPRRCGIATFTADLSAFLDSTSKPQCRIEVIPVDNETRDYTDEKWVNFQIISHNPESYRQAADYINHRDFDAVILQHEFGLFGGPFGIYVMNLVKNLRIPLITVMHSILNSPSIEQFEIVKRLGKHSTRIVTMSKTGLDLLNNKYRLETDRCIYIPHGVHDVPIDNQDSLKNTLGWSGRRVLITFGLLGPGKGIEYALDALSAIIESFPDVLYVIHGTTHPNIIKQDGEAYRQSLKRKVTSNHLENNVTFMDKFGTTEEVYRVLGASEICLTPHLTQEQITSGTLCFAMSAGIPIISTPYWYAQEMLADGQGALVPFRDADAIASEVKKLLADDIRRHSMGKTAYQTTRNMVWSVISQRYLDLVKDLHNMMISVQPHPSQEVE